MEHLTRCGIAYDLKKSPHIQVVEYNNYSTKYIFSSEYYKNKFVERTAEQRATANQKIEKKYNVKADMRELSDLDLYRKIEKRGFLIERDGEQIECLSNLIFVGEIRTKSY